MSFKSLNNSQKFWHTNNLFSETSGINWAIFRISISLTTILLFVTIGQELPDLYGKYGYLQHEVVEITMVKYQPRISWLMTFLHINDASEIAVLNTLYYLHIVFLTLLGLGCFTRISAFLALVIQLLFIGSGSAFSYGVDYILTNSLFYCLVFPVNKALSLDNFLFPKRAKQPMLYLYTWVLRLHLCMIYFFAGYAKSLGTTWWNGEAIWRVLMSSSFGVYDMSFMASVPFVCVVLGISVLILEIFYPIIFFKKSLRKIWLSATILMHIGIGVFMGLYFFAAVLIAWNITGFGEDYIKKLHIKWLN